MVIAKTGCPACAGIDFRETVEFECADTELLLPASDYPVCRLAPAPIGEPSVSLLIISAAPTLLVTCSSLIHIRTDHADEGLEAGSDEQQT